MVSIRSYPGLFALAIEIRHRIHESRVVVIPFATASSSIPHPCACSRIRRGVTPGQADQARRTGFFQSQMARSHDLDNQTTDQLWTRWGPRQGLGRQRGLQGRGVGRDGERNHSGLPVAQDQDAQGAGKRGAVFQVQTLGPLGRLRPGSPGSCLNQLGGVFRPWTNQPLSDLVQAARYVRFLIGPRSCVPLTRVQSWVRRSRSIGLFEGF